MPRHRPLCSKMSYSMLQDVQSCPPPGSKMSCSMLQDYRRCCRLFYHHPKDGAMNLLYKGRRQCCAHQYDETKRTVSLVSQSSLLERMCDESKSMISLVSQSLIMESMCDETMRMVSQSSILESPMSSPGFFAYMHARLNRYPRTRCRGINGPTLARRKAGRTSTP